MGEAQCSSDAPTSSVYGHCCRLDSHPTPRGCSAKLLRPSTSVSSVLEGGAAAEPRVGVVAADTGGKEGKGCCEG